MAESDLDVSAVESVASSGNLAEDFIRANNPFTNKRETTLVHSIFRNQDSREAFSSVRNVSQGHRPVVFWKGMGFESYKEVEVLIKHYEMVNHVKLFKRDSRTIEAMANRLRAPKKYYSNALKYGEVNFHCKYGGKIYKSVATNQRPNRSSFKQGCEMHIRFGVSDDGSQLVVKSMSEEHNHEINEETIVKEALHPDLCVYVSKLVWHDIHISIDDVKAKLEDYVLSVMFKGQAPPPRTRRQYFPSKKQIRYFMAKAKASLNISHEAEEKLEAQVEKLKKSHNDEKIIFNFKVQHAIENLDLVNEESMEEEQLASQAAMQNNDQNAKVLFCHQTPHQQRLLRRYNTQVILTQISDLHSKIPFPLFCMYVQTNVDYQLVGEFIVQTNDNAMIAEGLQTIKDWNPGWNPKFVIVDFNDEQITSVETVFQGTFVLISDASREQAWSDWLSMESNGVSEFQDDVVKYLDAIAHSYSEETLNKAARELEESDVWKMSDKMRNWFQLNWLAQAKRWVAGYRPDDYVLALHTERTIDDELKMFKSIKLANKSSPLQDVIQQLVEHVVPVSKKQYELLNKESFRLQNELYYLYSDIPNYLSNRPGKLTDHIYKRLKVASSNSYFITEIHPGIFSVQGSETPDDHLHTISFGDSGSYPSCDCEDWQRYKLPCVHLSAVYNTYPDWTWDMMSVPYRSNPIFNVDWSVVSPDFRNDTPGLLSDIGTQTTGANLLATCTPDFSMNKMGDPRRAAETPQVLATQCRGLLQQLSKLQLAHHSRDSLYRLKSELKELISIFSSTPKSKVLFPLSGLTLSGKSRKQIIASNQTVFEQYNVKLVTPKQVTEAAEAKLRAREAEAAVDDVDSDENEIDGMYISTVSEEQIVDESNDDSLTLSNVDTPHHQSLTATTRKRIQSPSPFLKPAEKRARQEAELVAASESISVNESNEGTILSDGQTVQFPSNATISTVIDGQTINIPLDQVAVAINASKDLKSGEDMLTFSTAEESETTSDPLTTDTSIK